LGRYETLLEKCEHLDIKIPSKKSYIKAQREVKDFIDSLLKLIDRKKLDRKRIVVGNKKLIVKGSWITSLVYPDGKTIEIVGKDISIELR
jgi:hypothetical protein